MVISAAIYLTVGLDLSINLPASEHLPNRRMRRQAPQKCLDDIKELQQPDIQACENLLTNATEVKANQFCQNGCASKLHDIYQKIHTDCGAYYPQVTDAFVKFLGELCEKNRFNQNCFYDLVDLQFHHSSSSFSCEITAPACSSGCRLFLMYIQNNVGCCIHVIGDGLKVSKPDRAAALDKLWKLCSMTPPPLCKV
jgi:hypothetical protein